MRTTFLRRIQSVQSNPRLAFECVAVPHPSVMVFLSDPYRSDLEDPFIVLVLVLVVMLGPTSRILSNYSLPMLRRPP